MNPHIFVVNCDLSKLSCDAWMLPTDTTLRIQPKWNFPSNDLSVPEDLAQLWEEQVKRVLPMRLLMEWDEDEGMPFVVNVGGVEVSLCQVCGDTGGTLFCEMDQVYLCEICDEMVHEANVVARGHVRVDAGYVEWFMEGVREYFQVVAEFFQGKVPRNKREKFLVALPVIGTGKSGARCSTGGIVVALIQEIFQAAEKYDFDIALVSIRQDVFTALQMERKRYCREHQIWEKTFDEDLLAEADRLSELARKNDLVLFAGSGVSAGAGLPVWGQLLDSLAEQAGLTKEERETIATINYLDAARIIELKLGGQNELNKAIAKLLQVKGYSLSCALLAGMPVGEVVTTNYNQMFELAVESTGKKLAVLPYAPTVDCDMWLLKLHGCVTHPEDIVLTREHYMRYQTRRSALTGIVQSLLITKHMMFIGFSLNDDNFHKVVDEVRRALKHNVPARKIGTHLSIAKNEIFDILWGEEMNILNMATNDVSRSGAKRKLEIFLDLLLAKSSEPSHFLLDPHYTGLLDSSQQVLRSSLNEFMQSIPKEAKEAPEYQVILETMKKLGYNENE